MKISRAIFPALLFASTIAIGQQQAVEEAIRKDQYEKHGKPGEDKLNEWLGGNLMNVTPATEYQFNVSVTQHVVTYKNGKVKDEKDMKYYLNNEKKMFGIEGSQMGDSKKKSDAKIISVYDNGANAMLMFNLTEKSLFAMNINAFRSRESMEAAKQPAEKKTTTNDMSCGKTGKTKNILGYNCYEWVCKKADAKSYTAMWVNSDVKISDMPFMGGGKVPSSYGKNTGINGGVLEVDVYENDELTTTMTVTEINTKEDLKLVTADYKRQQIPAVNFRE